MFITLCVRSFFFFFYPSDFFESYNYIVKWQHRLFFISRNIPKRIKFFWTFPIHANNSRTLEKGKRKLFSFYTVEQNKDFNYRTISDVWIAKILRVPPHTRTFKYDRYDNEYADERQTKSVDKEEEKLKPSPTVFNTNKYWVRCPPPLRAVECITV